MVSPAERHDTFVALGANLVGAYGDPLATLEFALVELSALSAGALQVSPFYESDPKDCPAGSPMYVNAVASLQPRSGESPISFLHKLQDIESKFGRRRTGVRNEARTLDLDLLSFGEEQMMTDELVLPHPRAHERRFVLEPWINLAGPDWLLRDKTLGDWLDECKDPPLLKLDSP